jgi:hypothetical protein
VDRRRFLGPAALVVAAVVVVLMIARSGSAPSVGGSDGAVAEESGRGISSSDTAGQAAATVGLGGDAFPRSPEGAVAAATAYGLALDGPEVFDAEHRAQVLDALAAAGARDDLEAAFGEGLDLIMTHLGLDASAREDPGFVWRVVPGGWQLREFDRDGATVAIWAAVVVIANDVLLVEPGWRTTEVTLVWESGAWRLVGFQTEPGPNPTFVAGAVRGEPVGRQINAFAPYRHWPHQAGPGEDR